MSDLKPQVYKDTRPAEHFQPFHDRVRANDPNWVYTMVRSTVTPPVVLGMRTRCIGLHHVPTDGPLIVAPNHFSQWDHFITGAYLRRRINFMAKSQMFSNKFFEFIFSRGGTFPVLRGRNDTESLKTAFAILERDGLLLMYPEGGRSRTKGELGQPKHGLGRIVMESGAPVVPVAIHGSDQLRSWRERLKSLKLPHAVTVQYGEPMHFEHKPDASREEHQEVSDQVFGRIREMYTNLSAALEAHPRRVVLRAAREGSLPELAAGSS
ncbi:MAG: lysophospholipid acyltransferase family protein [Solirubrobacterales bacterium]